MLKTNLLIILIFWLIANFLVPLLRNSIERICKEKIDSFLLKFLYYCKLVIWKLIQLILILFYCPTFLSKIPGFMREQAEKEYKPVAEALLDRDFPRKMIASWNLVGWTVFVFLSIVVIMSTVALLTHYHK